MAIIFREKNVFPSLLGPTSYIFAQKEVRPGKKKKRFAPLTAGTHQLHLHAKEVRPGKKNYDLPL